ncbi:hypothetical protein [Butyrivibrio proteoclasticus]|uniref:hypothetical protein n=1 Tax=Butyrivibrio proteoclasticus TaxID=43305 RepID=UPI001A98268E|nr:hypothetical protein [Butyrivibrio proteoclasticus]
MIAVGRGVKTPLFYVGTLDRMRNSDYKFNHTKEVMIIFHLYDNENFKKGGCL